MERIIESLRLEKPSKHIKSNPYLNTADPPVNRVPKSHMLKIFEHFQI